MFTELFRSWSHCSRIAISLSICLFFVCVLSVCQSARISQKPHVQISPKFMYVLPVSVAPSFSDGNVIRYVFPVLWTTSCFHGQNRTESKTTFMFRLLRQVVAPRAKSAISHCIFFVVRRPCCCI